MVTDVILSGLSNLFALFGAEEQIDLEASKVRLSSYLIRHFGIRDDSYISLYEELRDIYSLTPDLDRGAVVEQICSNMARQMSSEAQSLMLLRLMEFCDTPETEFNPDTFVFRKVAAYFGISDAVYRDYCDFTDAIESPSVIVLRYSGLDGFIKVLRLSGTDKLVFSYLGSDTVLLDDVPVLYNVFQTWTNSGVLKVRKTGLRVYHSMVMRHYATDIRQEDRIVYCGRDVNFRFPGSDNGIHNLSFTLNSGRLLAIMGGSGTGKTTLLSLLNGSLCPSSGALTINGHNITDPAAKALIGFVPQDDLLIEELTVYQNLYYTARLCFEGLADTEVNRRVVATLKDLDLLSVRDLKVGSPINKYISGGQRKRLNIALELIRQPAVLFLDEPTSGLSSADTEKVVNLLKEQTHKGRLVVINIHQPSSDVYKLFDRLWILDKGGYPVFDGNPIDAITYFKRAANYADSATSTCPVCGNVNPEVILNIIDAKALDSTGKLSGERKTTPQQWHQMYLDHRLPASSAEVTLSPLPSTPQRRPSPLKQAGIFLRRIISTKATNLQYLLITFLEAPLLALICALLTRFAPPEGYTVMDNKNLVSYIFMSVIVAIFLGMSGSAEEIIKDRALLRRERFLRLSHASYITSKIIFMAGVTLVQTLLFILVGNTIMGLSLFTAWWGILFLSAFLAGLIGLLLSQCLNSVVSIYISIPILLIPQILLCGLVVSFTDLTPGSTTGNVPLIGNVIPSRWAYEALAVTQFTDNDYKAPTFRVSQVKYEQQYYRLAYLYELDSQLKTLHDEELRGRDVKPHHMDIIRKGLPTLADVTGMAPYDGDYGYASLQRYFDRADSIMADRCNRAALAEDRMVVAAIKAIGKDRMISLKRDNYNLQLENFVLNADTKRLYDIIDGHIVPRAGYIYLTPRTHFGNAPFYSSVKMLGSTPVKTLWFNTVILAVMSFIIGLLLYLDVPGHWLRRHVN